MFKPYEAIQVGDVATLVREISERDIARFVEMTGDDNPLHVDRSYAETTPFKDIVVHGMLGASFISTIIGTRLPGTGALWVSQSLEFLLPVRLGDTLSISCSVSAKNERERLLDLDTRILNQNGALVLSGQGRVRVLESRQPAVVHPAPEAARVALVTGGAGGIGGAICRRLARDGFRIVVNYRGGRDGATAVIDAIVAAGGEAIAVQADVSNPNDVERLVTRTVQEFGGIGVLVNTAAPRVHPKPFETLEWSDVSHQLDGQLRSAFLVCKAAVPHMRAQRYGRIICITSQVTDSAPTPAWTSYAVAKSSVAALARSLAVELGPSGICVNCIAPGMTDTKMIGDFPEKARLIVARQTPLRRLAQPEDVAGAVAFLVSPDAAFITGETIRVNGGQVML